MVHPKCAQMTKHGKWNEQKTGIDQMIIICIEENLIFLQCLKINNDSDLHKFLNFTYLLPGCFAHFTYIHDWWSYIQRGKSSKNEKKKKN